MIKLKMEPEAPPRQRRRRLGWLLVLLLLVPVVALVSERWRGQSALKAWKRQMAAKGEIFDARQLWPPPSPESLEFSNRLALAVAQLPPGLGKYGSSLSGMVPVQPGQARRSSQEPKPLLRPLADGSNSWEDLGACMHLAQAPLESLRSLMQSPPSGLEYNVNETLETDSIPNYVNTRCGAQALNAAVLQDLHVRNLEAARADLTALSGYVRLREEDPTLVCFMIRIAILGLSVDAYWDALQAEGWTELQLAALQQASRCEKLPSEMSRSLVAERVWRIHQLYWFRSHSYREWVGKYSEFYQSFGMSLPRSETAGMVGLWRQWVFHPIWSFAWADQEQLSYLHTVQEDIETLRSGAEQGSWIGLRQQMAASHRNYRSPAASWRFYTTLPLVDRFSEIIGSSPIPAPIYPYPDFSRAWLTTMKNLTLNQMVSTVIALKRYELRHGELPSTLTALVPEFLPGVPHDYMDGQPLRYRVNRDASFTLYSVGENAVDDAGDPSPADLPRSGELVGPWTGRDWVWPRVVTRAR